MKTTNFICTYKIVFADLVIRYTTNQGLNIYLDNGAGENQFSLILTSPNT